MNSTTTMAPLLSNDSLLNESPFETSDELMLEELERRDGIYSFIFHELEDPLNDRNAEYHELQQMPARNGRRNSVTDKTNSKNNERGNSLIFLELEASKNGGNDEQHELVQVPTHNCRLGSISDKSNSKSNEFQATAPPIVSSASLQANTKTMSTLSGNSSNQVFSCNENFFKLPAKNDFLRYQQHLKTWFPPLMPAASSTATASSIKLLHATSTISGGSSSSYYLDKRPPSLYPYMMNCAVSVRKQPPRFSHITAPLVRNRRHALKECETYKQRYGTNGSGNNLLTPDLRSLFPHDPDVHAPFIKSDQKVVGAETATSCFKIESLKKPDSPARLPSCSEIKYEKRKI